MKYVVDYTSKFKKQHKKLVRQGKNLTKLYDVIDLLLNRESLDFKYKDNELVLLLFATGSHSDLFN